MNKLHEAIKAAKNASKQHKIYLRLARSTFGEEAKAFILMAGFHQDVRKFHMSKARRLKSLL
mgnify:CR=1 FL=1